MADKRQLKKSMKNWKNVNREMARTNKKFPNHMVEIPKEHWPDTLKAHEHQADVMCKPVAAWRSNKFFAQVVEEPGGAIRISINRTRINENYDFADGITWDDIFCIKNEIGYADKDCIEIYPAKNDLVNVSNIRHIFLLDEPHPLNWSLNKHHG